MPMVSVRFLRKAAQYIRNDVRRCAWFCAITLVIPPSGFAQSQQSDSPVRIRLAAIIGSPPEEIEIERATYDWLPGATFFTAYRTLGVHTITRRGAVITTHADTVTISQADDFTRAWSVLGGAEAIWETADSATAARVEILLIRLLTATKFLSDRTVLLESMEGWLSATPMNRWVGLPQETRTMYDAPVGRPDALAVDFDLDACHAYHVHAFFGRGKLFDLDIRLIGVADYC